MFALVMKVTNAWQTAHQPSEQSGARMACDLRAYDHTYRFRTAMKLPIQSYLEELHRRLADVQTGALADYIPELTKANPNWFGICLVTMDGVAYSVGDFEQSFTIQSISKPFVYGAALADRGESFMSGKVGVEPSGDAFNSISLNPQTGAPLNPMINAGAIASTSLVAGASAKEQWQRIESSMSAFIGRPVTVDESVYRSESETGFRNRAIAWMLKNFGIVDGDPMASLENYFRQCSINVNCLDLAYMAATLAKGGIHPVTGERALPAEQVERVLSVMSTCGMYDFAGSWMYEVGMPAKSGVGGGIIAVLPGRFGIGIFSPLLDEKGNSVRGIEVCKQISHDFGLHVFNHEGDPRMALGRIYTAAEAPSRRKPTAAMRAMLESRANRIKYLCLHGFLTVDGAEFIIRRMQELSAQSHSFILDMNNVVGISDSAARLMMQACAELGEDGIAVVFSRFHARPAIEASLRAWLETGEESFHGFEDNDRAVEWCENRLLGEQLDTLEHHAPMSDTPLLKGMPPTLMSHVEAISQLQHYAPHEQILVSGQRDDGRIFFIEFGQVSVMVPLENGGHQRIASLGPGMNFGEMVLLGHQVRSASVYADTTVHCRILDAADLECLSSEFPQLKIILLENLAKDMASNLRRATTWISALA